MISSRTAGLYLCLKDVFVVALENRDVSFSDGGLRLEEDAFVGEDDIVIARVFQDAVGMLLRECEQLLAQRFSKLAAPRARC